VSGSNQAVTLHYTVPLCGLTKLAAIFENEESLLSSGNIDMSRDRRTERETSRSGVSSPSPRSLPPGYGLSSEMEVSGDDCVRCVI
jgi:hypothetical protein